MGDEFGGVLSVELVVEAESWSWWRWCLIPWWLSLIARVAGKAVGGDVVRV